MAQIEKVGQNYRVSGEYVYTYNDLWEHTEKRIIDAENKAKSREEFAKKMITRLKRIKHKEKIYYAIAVLHKRGHQEIVDIYDGKLLMDELTSGWELSN